jgi:hypothetical protein
MGVPAGEMKPGIVAEKGLGKGDWGFATAAGARRFIESRIPNP